MEETSSIIFIEQPFNVNIRSALEEPLDLSKQRWTGLTTHVKTAAPVCHSMKERSCVCQESGVNTILYQFSTHISILLGKLYRLLFTEDGMSVMSLEREMEMMGITARERVLGDPDMLDIIFSYLDHRSVKRVRLVST